MAFKEVHSTADSASNSMSMAGMLRLRANCKPPSLKPLLINCNPAVVETEPSVFRFTYPEGSTESKWFGYFTHIAIFFIVF